MGENHALKNINLNARHHRVTAFIGPSGCGKSTLLRILQPMYDFIPANAHRPTDAGPIQRSRPQARLNLLRGAGRHGVPRADAVSG